mmetsp:Transcript_19661/g.39855  ORF Transcript_19661/g.39855 Transcript_19661/m.39855 type:complete len:299 (-) Transcript_19661:181-1077(-)
MKAKVCPCPCPCLSQTHAAAVSSHTSSTALTHPSSSGLFVIWANFAQATFPDVVTRPKSLTFTSMTVPFVTTPKLVYRALLGFFLTLRMSNWNVVLSSGCVTLAFFMRNPVGRMKRSYLGGLRVKFSPTKVHLVTTLFQALAFLLPVRITLNISSSATGLTRGIGTSHLPALSLRFCFTVLLSTFARLTPSRSSRYAGTAPSATLSSFACLLFRWSCLLIVFRIVAFSLNRLSLYSLARRPCTFCANSDRLCTSRASRLRSRSAASNRRPCSLRCRSMCSCCGMVVVRCLFVRLCALA